MSDLLSTVVDLRERSYPVYVGSGARHRIQEHFPRTARRIAVVTQKSIPRDLIPAFDNHLVEVFEVGPDESHKSLSTIESLCRQFSLLGLTRGDVVVGVGGGMVTDIAGFAAAVYHRGIAVAHVATSLLAMVDAAIGGKTGVNLPEGKNLVGAFWQPCVVACDTDALSTLTARELDCGHGEMAKYHFISRADLSNLPMHERILECVRIKADIVTSDEREDGRRALLNYGHTLAHAIETFSDYSIPHGVAVATGLLYAAHLAEVKGLVSAERVDDHYRVVHQEYGLSTPVPRSLTADAALEVMVRDKKAVTSLTFVLDSPDGLVVVPNVSADDAKMAFGRFVARVGQSA